MKAITIFISMLTVLVLNVNGQNTDVKGLLDNQDTRTEIFNAIANDHQLMMDFMQVAKKNEHGAMMMRNAENHEMGKMEPEKGGMMEMNDEHQMMDMMKDNPEMMQKMMGNMMQMCEKDTAMRSQMVNMMTEHPEMMKMCMQKMNEKGMMHPDGKMMNKEETSNHHNH
ncbi:MAG: hypothetical protein P1P82_17170 [Bacteroidales bacterium]|nr:hypothetical protein [Bacteroidales bacterium]